MAKFIPYPKAVIATTLDVLKRLEMTPEKRAEIEQEQAHLKELFNSRARLNPDERIRGRGVELEAHYRLLKNKNGIAEALAMQGRYLEAAQHATRKNLREKYLEQHNAVHAKDATCECDNFNDAGLPNEYAESYGYSEKHKKVVPFLRCVKCGALNARALPQHLAEMQQKRRAAEAKEK